MVSGTRRLVVAVLSGSVALAMSLPAVEGTAAGAVAATHPVTAHARLGAATRPAVGPVARPGSTAHHYCQPAASGFTCTYTAGVSTSFTVPPGVKALHIDVSGGRGGATRPGGAARTGGGPGGEVRGTLSIAALDRTPAFRATRSLQVDVGTDGAPAHPASASHPGRTASAGGSSSIRVGAGGQIVALAGGGAVGRGRPSHSTAAPSLLTASHVSEGATAPMVTLAADLTKSGLNPPYTENGTVAVTVTPPIGVYGSTVTFGAFGLNKWVGYDLVFYRTYTTEGHVVCAVYVAKTTESCKAKDTFGPRVPIFAYVTFQGSVPAWTDFYYSTTWYATSTGTVAVHPNKPTTLRLTSKIAPSKTQALTGGEGHVQVPQAALTVRHTDTPDTPDLDSVGDSLLGDPPDKPGQDRGVHSGV